MAYLDFDADDYINEISDGALEREYRKRKVEKQSSNPEELEDLDILKKDDYAQTLIASSDFLRMHDKIELAYKLDDLKCAFF